MIYIGFPGGSAVKNPPANEGDTGSIPGSVRCLGEGTSNAFLYFIWEIPRTEEPRGCGELQFMGAQRSQISLSN